MTNSMKSNRNKRKYKDGNTMEQYYQQIDNHTSSITDRNDMILMDHDQWSWMPQKRKGHGKRRK